MSKFAKLAGAGALASLAAMLVIAAPGAAQTAVRGGPVKGPPPERAASPYQAYRTAGSAMATVSDAQVAAIYDALPSAASGVTDGGLGRLQPEDQEFVRRARGGQACSMAEFKAMCSYFGTEAVNKTIAYTWSAPQSITVGGDGGPAGIILRIPKPGPCDDDSPPSCWPSINISGQAQATARVSAPGRAPEISVQLALLDYGFRKRMSNMGAERGLSDGQLAQIGIGDNAKGKLIKVVIDNKGFGPNCASDQKALGSALYLFKQHRLRTCGIGVGQRAALVLFGKEVFSLEWGVLLSHSHFMRQVGLWIPEAAEPQICANSVVHTSTNSKCNSYDWLSPLSATFGMATNSAPINVDSTGSATRIATGFNTLIDFQ